MRIQKTPGVVQFASGALLLILCSSSCGGSSDDRSCPSYLVTPGGGVAGFTAVGEIRTDAVCKQYCKDDYPVCELQTETVVKCMRQCV